MELSFLVFVAGFSARAYVIEILGFTADSFWPELAVLRIPNLVLATFLPG